MKLFERFPMRFEEEEYEIRVLYDSTVINVVAFRDNHPANGYRHQIKLPKKCDAQELLAEYKADELIEACKSDITEKRWEGLSALIQRASSG